MKRILGSLITLVLAASALVVGATYAPFTDTASDSGTVTAGTVSFDFFGGGSVSLKKGGVECSGGGFAGIKVGDTCTGSVKITNTSSLGEVGLKIEGALATKNADGTPGCGLFEYRIDQGATIFADVGEAILLDGLTLSKPGTLTVAVQVRLLETGADENDCQGDTATVTVTVTATQL